MIQAECLEGLGQTRHVYTVQTRGRLHELPLTFEKTQLRRRLQDLVPLYRPRSTTMTGRSCVCVCAPHFCDLSPWAPTLVLDGR